MRVDRKIQLYGISNCDQVKKARAWLEGHGLNYQFTDFKKAGVGRQQLAAWQQKHPDGWEALLNRKGTTWRGLPEERRAKVRDAASAAALMVQFPSLIKRPVLVVGERVSTGFSEALFQAMLSEPV